MKEPGGAHRKAHRCIECIVLVGPIQTGIGQVLGLETGIHSGIFGEEVRDPDAAFYPIHERTVKLGFIALMTDFQISTSWRNPSLNPWSQRSVAEMKQIIAEYQAYPS